MNETEWLVNSSDGGPQQVEAMLTFLGTRLSRRKQVLLACGSFYLHRNPAEDSEYPWELPARELAERFVDGKATPEEVAAARAVAEQAVADDPYAYDLFHNVIMDQAGKSVNLLRLATGEFNSLLEIPSEGMPYVRPFPYWGSPPKEEDLIRDVFGNPFAPIPTIDPAWLTSTVLALARGIYEERAFDRMPILADALQDAGCADESILAHCRGSGPHIRGCWVVDRLLGYR